MTPSRSRMTSFIILFFKFRYTDAAVDQSALARFEFLQLAPERLLKIELGGEGAAEHQNEQVRDLFRQRLSRLALGHALGYLAQLFGHQHHAVGHVLAALLPEAVLDVKRLHRREHFLIRIWIHKKPRNRQDLQDYSGFTRLNLKSV